MKVTRIHHDNSDLTVVNAARVSMDKFHESFDKEKDTGLIRYLAKNNHWTPIAHPRYRFSFAFSGDAMDLALWASSAPGAVVEMDKDPHPMLPIRLQIEDSLWGWLTNPPPGLPFSVLEEIRELAPVSYDAIESSRGIPWRESGFALDSGFALYHPCEGVLECVTLLIEAPIFVFRQLMRSNVGIVYNEVSRRYVDDSPKFFYPNAWRARPNKSIKQGSGGNLAPEFQEVHSDKLANVIGMSTDTYESMLEDRVAPEQARMVLPQNMISKIWMTATNKAMERVLGLREDSHAQKEIRDLAGMMRKAVS